MNMLIFWDWLFESDPAHDMNDKALGEKHNLEIIDIFNEDATMNSFGLHYRKDRFVVRAEIEKN
jgi:valyl-tRNA synthetase